LSTQDLEKVELGENTTWTSRRALENDDVVLRVMWPSIVEEKGIIGCIIVVIGEIMR